MREKIVDFAFSSYQTRKAKYLEISLECDKIEILWECIQAS